jgi:putative methyltransferase
MNYSQKLTHTLAILLLHDHLLTKGGIATSSGPLKNAILKHKARISAEFTRAKVRRGYGSTPAFLAAIAESAGSNSSKLPRWVRVNTLKMTFEHMLQTAFEKYTPVEDLSALFDIDVKSNLVYYKDPYIPNLIAFPPSMDLTEHPLYASGALILQDRSSCFPACLLAPPADAVVIDATAAPGNKTTHIAAILGLNTNGKVIAFERDARRAQILKTMVAKAGGDRIIEVRAGQDFLKADPSDKAFARVTHLLLDPSCSGSGIVTREEYTLIQPPTPPPISTAPRKKRRRDSSKPSTIVASEYDTIEQEPVTDDSRLVSLASFQTSMIIHAMSFPAARKITYSTCSIHGQENELVVASALTSAVARRRGWCVEKRYENDSALQNWSRRGLSELCGADVAEACIRCEPVRDGGIGFFVVAFRRDRNEDEPLDISEETPQFNQDQEWKGFSDNDIGNNEVLDVETENTKSAFTITNNSTSSSTRKNKNKRRKKVTSK